MTADGLEQMAQMRAQRQRKPRHVPGPKTADAATRSSTSSTPTPTQPKPAASKRTPRGTREATSVPSETATNPPTSSTAVEAPAPQWIGDMLKLASDTGRAWAAAQRKAREQQQRWAEALRAAQRLGATREQLRGVVTTVAELAGASRDQLPAEAREMLP